jgi:tRNA (guanine26-N2/guanine27-N2)-dimethyltransferase
MDFVEVTEGGTTFFVPVQDPLSHFPPGSAAVFYNRRMELSRDATVLLLQVIKPADYLDAMGATGVRGLRVAHECGLPVTINDRNAEAIDLIRKNVALLGLPIEVTHQDVNVLTSMRRFDAVDLDPFGTPAPFIDSAARSARHHLFVTATDTAPLCGAHLKAGMRRYFSRPGNTEYHGEVALRTLLYFVVREVIKYDRGVEPVFCFSHEHFVRLHLNLAEGAQKADAALAHIGFVLQCPHCLFRTEVHGIIPCTDKCPYCERDLTPIGPLWLGAVNNTARIADMEEKLDALTLSTRPQLQKILSLCREELETSSHYDYHRVAKILRVSPPPIEVALQRLQASGYRASRTHYSGTGIKTDAPPEILMQAIHGE